MEASILQLLPIFLLLCPSWRPDQNWIYLNAAYLCFCTCAASFQNSWQNYFQNFSQPPMLWSVIHTKNVFYITSNGTRHQWGVSLTTTSPKWEAEDTLQSIANKGHIVSRVTAGIPVAVLFWKLVWWERLHCCQHRLLLLLLRLDKNTPNNKMQNNFSEKPNFKEHFQWFSVFKHWRQI